MQRTLSVSHWLDSWGVKRYSHFFNWNLFYRRQVSLLSAICGQHAAFLNTEKHWETLNASITVLCASYKCTCMCFPQKIYDKKCPYSIWLPAETPHIAPHVLLSAPQCCVPFWGLPQLYPFCCFVMTVYWKYLAHCIASQKVVYVIVKLWKWRQCSNRGGFILLKVTEGLITLL